MKHIRNFFNNVKNIVLNWWLNKLSYTARSVIRFTIVTSLTIFLMKISMTVNLFISALSILWGFLSWMVFIEGSLEKVTEKQDSFVNQAQTA